MSHVTALAGQRGTGGTPGRASLDAIEGSLGISLDEWQWWCFDFDDHEIVSAVVLVTPAMANKWLTELNGVTPGKDNRNLSGVKWREWYHRMRDGRWKVSPQSVIAFDEDGDLLDGQHRLVAIRRLGAAVWFRVEYGWPRESFSILDSGAKRLASQIIGGKHAVMVAASGRIVAAVTGLASRDQIHDKVTARADPDLIDGWVREWPELRQYSSRVKSVYRACRLNEAIHLAVVAQASRTEYRDMLDDWFFALETGANLSLGDPRLQLRRRWNDDYRSLSGSSSARGYPYALTVKAWNEYVTGNRSCKNLKVGPKEQEEIRVVGFNGARINVGLFR